MEIISKEKHQLKFYGDGGKLFGIYIVNLLLTMVTLGFYYPWAKATKLQYMYQETEFAGSRFAFLGTGKEMFKGFIKAVIIFMVLYALILIPAFMHKPEYIIVGAILFYIGFIVLIPIAIHGSMRYRMSRTTWRGIHFGYRGNRNELVKEFIKGVLLTAVTIGLYGSWFTVKLRKYVIGNIRLGNLKFSYNADGLEYFVLNLKGLVLTIVTFGVYYFWYMKDVFNFYVENIKIEQDEKTVEFTSEASGSEFFKIIFVNIILVVITLGLATPWTIIRTMRYVASCINVDSNLDVDNIQQTEEDYKNATGDDVADLLDINLV